VGLVLDTSALIELERALRSDGALEIPWDEVIVVPAVVWAEALIGVRLADSPVRAARRRAHLEVVRKHAGIEAFTRKTAAHYADIYAELSAQGTLIPQNDIAVAATCRMLGFGALVGPRDEAHFRLVPGLEVHVMSAAGST
jgi:predicted nucleic acid-binding protein